MDLPNDTIPNLKGRDLGFDDDDVFNLDEESHKNKEVESLENIDKEIEKSIVNISRK